MCERAPLARVVSGSRQPQSAWAPTAALPPHSPRCAFAPAQNHHVRCIKKWRRPSVGDERARPSNALPSCFERKHLIRKPARSTPIALRIASLVASVTPAPGNSSYTTSIVRVTTVVAKFWNLLPRHTHENPSTECNRARGDDDPYETWLHEPLVSRKPTFSSTSSGDNNGTVVAKPTHRTSTGEPDHFRERL